MRRQPKSSRVDGLGFDATAFDEGDRFAEEAFETGTLADTLAQLGAMEPQPKGRRRR